MNQHDDDTATPTISATAAFPLWPCWCCEFCAHVDWLL